MSDVHNYGNVGNQVNVENFRGTIKISGDHRKDIPNFHTPFHSSAEKIIGREVDIQHLRERMLHSKVPVLLTGMGGIGKTRMAIEYANRFKEEYDYIVWIEQLGDLITDLTSDFALNQGLNFQPSKDPQADVRNILFQLSRLEGSLLLIIDNTNDQIEELSAHLPKPPNAHVLMTSRQELGDFFSVIQLGFLSEDFARILFYEHYKRERNDEVTTLILKDLDYHTLTIELFSKTANRRKIGLKELQSLIEKKGLAFGKRADDIRLIRDPKRQLKKIFHFLQIVFDIGGLEEDEKKLLQHLAALPSLFVPLTGLGYLLNIDREKGESWDDFIFNLTQLQEKGWLIYDDPFKEKEATVSNDKEKQKREGKRETQDDTPTQEETYKMHRVIQDVVWEQLAPSFESLQTIFKQVTNLLTIDQAKDNPVEKFPFVPFAERLLKLFPREYNESIALLKNELALVYKALGRYEEAADLLEKALQADLTNFGEAHPNVARSQSNLAVVYKDLGRYEQAADLLEKALQADLTNFGEAHPTVAISQSNLALVYQALGRYEQAADLLEKALQADLTNFGEAHPNVARRQSNLALVYKDLGRYKEAADLLEKALQADLTNFGEAHPNVARSQSNLAVVYQDLGRYEQAADLLEKALQADLTNFGEAHPNVARSQSNLAVVYKDLGRYEQAADLLEKALQADLTNFGEAHPNVARRQSNLANVYKDLGRYEQAADLLEKALQADLTNFGEAHPNVAISQSNLAVVYKDLGRYEQAADLLEKALQADLTNFGEAHPNVARSQSNLAVVYKDLGRYEEAIPLFIQAMNIMMAVLGANHPNVQTIQGNILFTLQKGVDAGDAYCQSLWQQMGLDKLKD